MYLTCVRHRVKDYAQWRSAFDINAAILFERAGVLGTSVVQIGGDATDIAIINTWPSKKHWDDFGVMHAASSLKDAVKTPEEGGVIGEIQFWGGEVM